MRVDIDTAAELKSCNTQ